ncbi:MAG: methylenetetrahydrofolate reductase [Chloroflexi bacterium]|nr:methylenetetrahydrofolate reductase [Chloroflexota bacterium]
MRIGEFIAQEGTSLSFEFFPPRTPADEERLMETVRTLEAYRPAFVSVTYGAGGGTLKNTRHLVERIKQWGGSRTRPPRTRRAASLQR